MCISTWKCFSIATLQVMVWVPDASTYFYRISLGLRERKRSGNVPCTELSRGVGSHKIKNKRIQHILEHQENTSYTCNRAEF